MVNDVVENMLKNARPLKTNLHYIHNFGKTVTCNLLTTWVVLCKSSTQLTYVVVGEFCMRLIYTVQLKF
jgi:hypothetical protein